MERPSDQQIVCNSRATAKKLLVQYTMTSFVAGFVAGVTIIAIPCIHHVQEMLKENKICYSSGNLVQEPTIVACPSISSES